MSTINPYTKNLIRIVNQYFIRQVGPFGQVICKEQLTKWIGENRRPTYMNLPAYIDALFEELPDHDSRQAFANDLKNNEHLAQIDEIQRYIETL